MTLNTIESIGSVQNEQLFANYSKLTGISIPFKTHLNYSSLIGKFFGRLPDDFFRLFTNIQAVEVHQKVETRGLLNFLRAAKTVRSLKVYECELDLFADTVDGLTSVQSISDLKIAEQNRSISLDFLSRLHRLTCFELQSFELPLRSVFRAFEACKYFDTFYFDDRPKSKSFQLYRAGSQRFTLAERNGKTTTKLETIFKLLSQDDELNIV